jgi:tRNA pseudouridine-54 N-methylase
VEDAASTTTTSNPNEEYLADKIQEEYRCYVVNQAGDQIKDVKGRPYRGCGKYPDKP